jgi:hypothetical protein
MAVSRYRFYSTVNLLLRCGGNLQYVLRKMWKGTFWILSLLVIFVTVVTNLKFKDSNSESVRILAIFGHFVTCCIM